MTRKENGPITAIRSAMASPLLQLCVYLAEPQEKENDP
jgi:hypothetical protein